jgi:superfamily II DNA helicase RecQ
MTATSPPALTQRIVATLRLNEPAIFRISPNRVNHIYAVHRVVGSLNNMANLRMLVPNTLSADAPATRETLLSLVKKTLIFMDSKKLITATPHALYEMMPERLQKLARDMGYIRVFHSDMSREYLDFVLAEFSKPNGSVRIAVASTGASTVESTLSAYRSYV